MKYDKRLEARTRIGELRLDIKGDLNHTEARYSTWVIELLKKIRTQQSNSDKGNCGNGQR